jgi:hypothetical protein
MSELELDRFGRIVNLDQFWTCSFLPLKILSSKGLYKFYMTPCYCQLYVDSVMVNVALQLW